MSAIEILKTNRRILNKIVKELSAEQLEIVPAGFNNNILWNVLHVLVTQQILHYKLANLPLYVDDKLVSAVRKGTSPAQWESLPDINQYVALLDELPLRLEEDYAARKFENYQPYMTSTGFELKNIDGAIDFNNFHEGIHTGVIMAIRKFI